MLIFILVVLFLVFAIAAFDSNRKKADDEQEFRMYKDPEYRKFIEEKRAAEKVQAKKKFRSDLILMVVLVVIIALCILIRFSL